MNSASTSNASTNEPKNLDEFYENNENIDEKISDNEEEEEFFDLTTDFDSFMNRFIDQRRNEISLELRRLQYTDQSSNRSRLQNWFNTNINNDRQFRSSDIQNEIVQLGSIGRVSSVLSTSRSQIESVIRRMVSPLVSQSPIPPPPPLPQITQTPPPQNPSITSQANELVRAITQISREQIFEEISELVHRQLVSNSLRSDFRSVLEQRVMDRLNRIGTDGEQTREFIRNLPTNQGIIRNDFTNLGLNDDAESVSSIIDSRTRATANTREIKSLRKEIGELREMLKLSFELQLDMQKSLKQEISALINNTFTDKTYANLFNSNRPTTGGKCIICTESDSDTVFYQCGHLCACYKCSMNLKQKNHSCPVCRAPIKDFLRAYKCGND
ncbi:unnamed protein product [Brachionus calyciflorus]|uniref:RING-type domain-containing protein n=1 Tax=Brachionus calyciflorus TaxID=104777 RepID=A0A813MKR3_9BILA|nr:unnamed protein product [Brachionus calyciflorus]